MFLPWYLISERLAVVAVALADLARHVHVGQEVHLDLDRALARHASQRPPLTLKLNRPAVAADLGLGGSAKSLRIASKTPVYVAGLERGVRPIGDWSISMTLSICSMPLSRRCLPAGVVDL